jgi:hypothetical protein
VLAPVALRAEAFALVLPIGVRTLCGVRLEQTFLPAALLTHSIHIGLDKPASD